jgi:ferric-dicitrate binding protein FerR (iron transport regulator)
MLEHHHILLSKYFGGTANEEDLLLLDEWLAESKTNDEYFIETSKLYTKIRVPSTNHPAPNKAKANLNLHNYINKSSLNTTSEAKKNIRFTSNRKTWTGIAAGLAIICTVSIGLNLIFSNQKEYQYISKNAKIKEILPDKTNIELAENSQVSYKENTNKGNKIVHLDGKAFFDISKKSSGQLIVCTQDVFIRDIGTSFTVDAYKTNDFVKVTVNTGMVDFYTNTNKGIRIRENETGIYNKKTKTFSMLIAQANKPNAAIDEDSKSTKVLNCDGMTLDKLVSHMNNRFESKIEIADKSIGEEQISVSFDGTENLDLMLQVISQTMDLNVSKKGEKYILSKNK